MARRIIVCLALLAVLTLAVGCQSTTVVPQYQAPAVAVQPATTYELVGDTTGSAEGIIILGLFTLGVESKYAALPGAGPLPACKVERNALYNAFMKVSTADSLVCPVMTIDETNYFVFKKKKVNVRAKAVKYAAKAIQ